MSKPKVVLYSNGVAELLKSKEMQDALESYARDVKLLVGENAEVVTYSRRAVVNRKDAEIVKSEKHHWKKRRKK